MDESRLYNVKPDSVERFMIFLERTHAPCSHGSRGRSFCWAMNDLLTNHGNLMRSFSHNTKEMASSDCDSPFEETNAHSAITPPCILPCTHLSVKVPFDLAGAELASHSTQAAAKSKPLLATTAAKSHAYYVCTCVRLALLARDKER